MLFWLDSVDDIVIFFGSLIKRALDFWITIFVGKNSEFGSS